MICVGASYITGILILMLGLDGIIQVRNLIKYVPPCTQALKIKGEISPPCLAPRQGGLISPFIFNVFFNKDIIDTS